MGQTKLSQGRVFAPFYGWTKQDYEEALLRVVPESPKGVSLADTPSGLTGLLAAIGKPLPWQRDAACLEHPEIDFFDDHAQDAAKAVCRRCLVRAECRTAGEHEKGVWGATTAHERARLRRAKVA